MNNPSFDPSEQYIFKIHTQITSQGFIFINFDASSSPSSPFTTQVGDDFDAVPTNSSGLAIGNEYAILARADEWIYDHNWTSASSGTDFYWNALVDGFQEFYHCVTGHPMTLPKDFSHKDYKLQQGIGASKHLLPPVYEKDDVFKESYITWILSDWNYNLQ